MLFLEASPTQKEYLRFFDPTEFEPFQCGGHAYSGIFISSNVKKAVKYLISITVKLVFHLIKKGKLFV